MSIVRILLIDDHAMIRSGLHMVLGANMPDAEFFESGSLSEAMQNAPDLLHLILLDIKMPGLNGIEGLVLLKKKWPTVPVLMLSSQDDTETVRSAIAHGATDFISKAESAERITALIRLILSGEHTAPTAQSVGRGGIPFAPLQMTPRQCEVLDLLCRGMSNKLIGRELHLSEHTVRGHVQALLEILNVSTRSEAVFAARQRGLVN